MFLDNSHSEDSALLIDFDGFTFLDMNDCQMNLKSIPVNLFLVYIKGSAINNSFFLFSLSRCSFSLTIKTNRSILPKAPQFILVAE